MIKDNPRNWVLRLAALSASVPILLAYVLSFINVGLYWNNHYHLMHAAEQVDGRVLWANLFLLVLAQPCPLRHPLAGLWLVPDRRIERERTS